MREWIATWLRRLAWWLAPMGANPPASILGAIQQFALTHPQATRQTWAAFCWEVASAAWAGGWEAGVREQLGYPQIQPAPELPEAEVRFPEHIPPVLGNDGPYDLAAEHAQYWRARAGVGTPRK